MNKEEFFKACQSGDLEQVKTILGAPGSDIHAKNNWGMSDWGLICACRSGNEELVNYMLNSPDLSGNSTITQEVIKDVCASSKTAMAYLILTHTQSAQVPHLQEIINNTLLMCGNAGKKETIEMLLSSSEIPCNADIHYQKDELFKGFCNTRKDALIEYIIFEKYVEKTQDIVEYLHNYTQGNNAPFRNESHDIALKMFKLRELHDQLQIDLPENNTLISARVKI